MGLQRVRHAGSGLARTHAQCYFIYFVVQMAPALTAGGSCIWLQCPRGFFFSFSSSLLPLLATGLYRPLPTGLLSAAAGQPVQPAEAAIQQPEA